MVSGHGTMDDLSVYISPNCQEPRCSGFVIRKFNRCLRCVSNQDAQIRTAQSSQLSKCYFILVAAQAENSGVNPHLVSLTPHIHSISQFCCLHFQNLSRTHHCSPWQPTTTLAQSHPIPSFLPASLLPCWPRWSFFR